MKKETYFNVYSVALVVIISLFGLLFIKSPSGVQSNVFFVKTHNYMADYFNVAKYSSENDPYNNAINGPGEKAYLPITYVLFNILSRFADYKHQGAFEAGLSSKGLVSASFFILVSSLAFMLLLFSNINGDLKKKYLLVFTFVFSGIYMFSFERGNVIILAAFFVTFFIFGYNSKNKFIRELSYISLAFAAALKAYPALLGLLVLSKKQYKESLRIIVYGFILSFGPFLIIKGGISNIPIWYSNFKISTLNYLYAVFPRFGHYYFVSIWANKSHLNSLISKEILNFVFSILTILISCIIVISTFFEKKEWRIVGCLISVILIFPVNSALYCGLYLFPLIVLFFNDDNHEQIDFSFVLVFIIMLCPLQVLYHKINLTTVMINIALFFMSVFFCINGIRNIASRFPILKKNSLL